MWGIVRLGVIIAAFLATLLRSRKVSGQTRSHEGETLTFKPTYRNRNSTAITKHQYAAPCVTPRFYLSFQNWFDRLCAGIGLTAEAEIGDPSFDDQVYIGCDAVELWQALKNNSLLRQDVLLLTANDITITGTGSYLIATSGSTDLSEKELSAFTRIVRALRTTWHQQSASNLLRQVCDPFTLRLLVVESFAIAVVIYVVSTIFTFFETSHNWILLEPARFVMHGVFLGVVCLIVFVMVSSIALAGSSRKHRFLGLVLLAGVIVAPLAGNALLYDILPLVTRDTSERVPAIISRKELVHKVCRRSGRGISVSTHSCDEHYLHLSYQHRGVIPGYPALPARISVAGDVFRSFRDGEAIVFTLHKTSLNVSYMRGPYR